MDNFHDAGHVIFLNGTSSAGKSSIARELQKSTSTVYLHVSVDNFMTQLPHGLLEDPARIEPVFTNLLNGFNNSAAALARTGNHVIVDHVLEPHWVGPCVNAFADLKVTFVAVRCPLAVLETREKARGDREIGLARYQYERVHVDETYDVEVDTSTQSAIECAAAIREFIASEKSPSAFSKLRFRHRPPDAK